MSGHHYQIVYCNFKFSDVEIKTKVICYLQYTRHVTVHETKHNAEKIIFEK